MKYEYEIIQNFINVSGVCVCVVAVAGECVHVICHRRRLQGFDFAVPSNRSLGYGTLRVRSASK